MNKSRLFLALVVGLSLLGAGCAPTPEAPKSTPLDTSKVSCDQIDAARHQVLQNYQIAVTEAADTFQKAVEAFESDLNTCLANAWKGGPCDNEWKASQEALTQVQGNVMNDVAYNGWKKAKADWDACYANWDAKYADWSAKGKQREELCRDEFNAKRDAAIKANEDAIKAAATQRDADLAKLDELEKSCKEKSKTQTGGGVTTGGGSVTTGTTPPATTPWIQTPTTVATSACQPAGIPGSNSTPRTGRATDFGAKDIVIGLITQVAEDVTGSPVPTGILDNQIFAGMVTVKIRTRIAEMEIEESDAQLSNQRGKEIRLRRKLDQYRRALDVWGKIAEGRPPVSEIKKDVAQLQSMPSGMCQSDLDCGSPLCCSANTIATSHCDDNGACVAQANNCPGAEICMGPDPAQPYFDHCGPNHDGNWGYGQSMPSGSPANRPAPGVAR